MKPEPAPPTYIMKGMRFPWDPRPLWMWQDGWHLRDLPRGKKWAAKLYEKLHAKEEAWKNKRAPRPTKIFD